MTKSEGFSLDIVFPQKQLDVKIIKQLNKVFPEGTTIKMVANTSTLNPNSNETVHGQKA